MKIYTGKNKRKSKQITFEDLLISKLKESGFKIHNDCFSDGSLSWIEVTQKTKKPSEITINFCFEDDVIDTINVYETDIITILDNDNTKKLI